MNDARPRDIYVDKRGTLWRVIATCSEPTVIAEQVEDKSVHQSGGISGYMWQGFQLVYRPTDEP